ncbi:hypothetical protein D3C78_1558600 [compost metagenome]
MSQDCHLLANLQIIRIPMSHEIDVRPFVTMPPRWRGERGVRPWGGVLVIKAERTFSHRPPIDNQRQVHPAAVRRLIHTQPRYRASQRLSRSWGYPMRMGAFRRLPSPLQADAL